MVHKFNLLQWALSELGLEMKEDTLLGNGREGADLHGESYKILTRYPLSTETEYLGKPRGRRRAP